MEILNFYNFDVPHHNGISPMGITVRHSTELDLMRYVSAIDWAKCSGFWRDTYTRTRPWVNLWRAMALIGPNIKLNVRMPCLKVV